MDLLFKEVLTEYQTIVYNDTCPVHFYNVDSNEFLFRSEPETDVIIQSTDRGVYELNKKNKLASVSAITKLVVVEKNEDKISLKFFYNTFSRRFNSKWFTKTKRVEFVTYRFKDGAVFYGDLRNYHKKRKVQKIFKRYTFGSQDIVNSLYRRSSLFYGKTYSSSNVAHLTFDQFKPVNNFIKNIPGTEKYENSTMREKFYKVFLEKNGIKYSNNFMCFSETLYPSITKKILKKHDFKMIDSIMELNQLKGGKIKRVLHKLDSLLTPHIYHILINVYGEQKILQQEDDFLISVLGCKTNFAMFKLVSEMTNKEINNSLEIVKLVLNGIIDFNTLKDHIKYYNHIKKYEDIRWSSQDNYSFVEEHMVWSDKYAGYTSGVFERLYPQEFLDHVQKPIKGLVSNYFPVVLRTTDEYNRESSKQFNCVRNYIKHSESLIISLREGSTESPERITIEYRIIYHEKRGLILNRVQTKAKRNENVTDHQIIDIIDKLDYAVDKSVELKMFNNYGIKVGTKYGGTKESGYKPIPFQRGGNTDYKITWENEDIIYNVREYQNDFLFNLEDF
jgi:hypothetical protein